MHDRNELPTRRVDSFDAQEHLLLDLIEGINTLGFSNKFFQVVESGQLRIKRQESLMSNKDDVMVRTVFFGNEIECVGFQKSIAVARYELGKTFVFPLFAVEDSALNGFCPVHCQIGE